MVNYNDPSSAILSIYVTRDKLFLLFVTSHSKCTRHKASNLGKSQSLCQRLFSPIKIVIFDFYYRCALCGQKSIYRHQTCKIFPFQGHHATLTFFKRQVTSRGYCIPIIGPHRAPNLPSFSRINVAASETTAPIKSKGICSIHHLLSKGVVVRHFIHSDLSSSRFPQLAPPLSSSLGD